MKRMLMYCVALMSVMVLIASCASDKQPAETAIKAAEEAINAVKGDAAKYVPDQLKGVEDALKAAKDSAAKGDYKAALASAKDLPAKAKELGAAAQAKKAELTKSWEEMSASLPKTVEEIKAKIDALVKSKKLPAGMDKEKLEGAKTGYTEITDVWNQAMEAFKAGNVADALAKAKTVKEKAAEIMTNLGMKAPEAPKG